MIYQRWGSFSVRDHVPQQAFILEALLYDRLVIPVPPDKKDDPQQKERKRWINKRWNPERLEALLEILGTDLASPIPWTLSLQESFKTRLATQHPMSREFSYYMTPLIVAGIDPDSRPDLFPPLPAHEPKPRILPAYPSPAKAKKDIQIAEIKGKGQQKPSEARDLAITIGRAFLQPKGVFTPRGVSLEKELLQQAVDLAKEDEFKKNRRQFYEWEENVIHKGLSTQDSIEQMRYLLNEHEKLVRRAWKDAMWKRVLTVFVIGSSVAGSALALSAGNVPGAVATGFGAVASVGRFIKFDYRPVVQPNETAPAVMLHTIRKRLDLEP